jgi:hypothetical protein
MAKSMVTACAVCATIFKAGTLEQGGKCPHGDCNGTIVEINPLFLLAVVTLNSEGIIVKETAIQVNTDNIVVTIEFDDDYSKYFCDDHTNRTCTPPDGFEFSYTPIPYSDKKVVQLKTVISNDLSNHLRTLALFKAAAGLLEWAEGLPKWEKKKTPTS